MWWRISTAPMPAARIAQSPGPYPHRRDTSGAPRRACGRPPERYPCRFLVDDIPYWSPPPQTTEGSPGAAAPVDRMADPPTAIGILPRCSRAMDTTSRRDRYMRKPSEIRLLLPRQIGVDQYPSAPVPRRRACERYPGSARPAERIKAFLRETSIRGAHGDFPSKPPK